MAALAISILVILVYGLIAWTDLHHLRIGNRMVLLALSFALLALIKAAPRVARGDSGIGRRLNEISEQGRVPYALPMLGAGGVALAMRALQMPA